VGKGEWGGQQRSQHSHQSPCSEIPHRQQQQLLRTRWQHQSCTQVHSRPLSQGTGLRTGVVVSFSPSQPSHSLLHTAAIAQGTAGFVQQPALLPASPTAAPSPGLHPQRDPQAPRARQGPRPEHPPPHSQNPHPAQSFPLTRDTSSLPQVFIQS